MSTNSTSGENQATSGASANYPADFVEKLKKEKENLSKALQAQRDELEKIKKEAADRAESELQKNQQFKDLWEKEKQEREKVLGENQKLSSMIQEGSINSALRLELSKLGVKESYMETALKLVDRNTVRIDDETKTIYGADQVAKDFYQKHKELGFFKQPGTSVNHNAPKGMTGAGLDVSKMSQQEKLQALRALHNKKT